MKKRILLMIPIALVLISATFYSMSSNDQAVRQLPTSIALNDTIKSLKPLPKYVNESRAITQYLNLHYRKTELGDSLSSVILDEYIKALDYNRSYFVSDDIRAFEQFRYVLDDDLKMGNVDVAYLIFAVFQQRIYERLDYVFTKLANPEFNFNLDEELEIDRSEAEWANSSGELDDLWRKLLKNQVLSLKISGKDLTASNEIVVDRYERTKKTIQQYKSADVFQLFMNSLAESHDPHTNYFNPMTAENFNIDMNKSFEGIGARLTKDGDYTVVASVIPGGPAFKSNLIHDKDKIVGVGQVDPDEIVDVVGWRNDDVVKLIRGEKGSVVHLQILKDEDALSSKPKVVKLIRDKINLLDQRAKSEVISFDRGGKEFKMGVITIPDFYKNFKDANAGVEDYISTTRDVKKLITDLKTQGIDGIMIDLRRNGGGALDEAIELTGLFIKDGPVVQVRRAGGGVEVYEDSEDGVFYDGPLTVLSNRFSASASEIFAGAIQDYKRGVVIGEQTFGKGTVQTVIDLNGRNRNKEDKWGNLKLTFAKFYRVNGSSTQHLGVTPDITFPSAYSAKDFGESSMPSALPWDQISSSEYSEVDNVTPELLTALLKNYEQRLSNDPGLKDLVDEIEDVKIGRERKSVTLNELTRKAQIEEIEAKQAKRAKPDGAVIDLEYGGVKVKNLNIDDQYLKEGLLILSEIAIRNIG